MKLVTRDSDYAIRALIEIARRRPGVVTAGELVKSTGIPRPFLRKILQVLNKNGIVKSFKGRGGGFTAGSGETAISDVMAAFQGRLSLLDCTFKKKACSRRGRCGLRKRLEKIESRVLKELDAITISSLL